MTTPGMRDVPGLFFVLEVTDANNIELTGRVVAMRESDAGVHCLLREDSYGTPLTYQVFFGGKTAEFILTRVQEDDYLGVSGCAYQIKTNYVGPYLQVRRCVLEYVKHKDGTIEDDASLWSEGEG